MADNEWRQCAEWLVQCGILAPDHKVTWPSAEVFDLVQTLRDGVLICHLLNALIPGVIDQKDFSQRPQMSQFLCLKNIRVFLQTCRTKFGLKDADLFDSFDLFEVKNFGKVIITLSKLSKTPAALNSGIPGFPKDNVNLQAKFNTDYYNTLEELATTIPDPDDDIYDAVYQDREDDQEIYDDLCSIRRKSTPQSSIQPQSQRDYCIKELIETERNYVDALNMIITHFIRPLKGLITQSVLSQSDYNTIFMGIEQLHTVHSGFVAELSRACTTTDGRGVGDCFIKWKKKFLIYGEFCSNLQAAQDKVDELCHSSPTIKEKFEDCQKNCNDGKFRLRDLLSVPMQRVLKYSLLLMELKKNTDTTHPGRTSLEKALEEMQDLSWYVNEVKRDNETLQTIKEIQDSIVDLKMPEGMGLKDYGKFLKDGEIKVKCHGDNRNRLRYIFLFDKVMLMCKSRAGSNVKMVDKFLWGETYSYKHALILSEHHIDEAASANKTKGQHWTHQFLLVENQNQTAYTFAAKTDDTRNKWIEAIRMALDNTSPRGSDDKNHKFVMHTYNEPTECDFCEKMLRGVFFQGYQCKVCKKNAHKECIPKVPRCGARRESGPGAPPRPLPTRQFAKVIGKCKANYSYKGIPQPNDDRPVLHFEVDDIISVLNKDDEHWWEGRTQDGQEGYFPAQYVKMHPQVQRGDTVNDLLNRDVFSRPPPVHRGFSLDSQAPPPRNSSPSPANRQKPSSSSPVQRRTGSTNNDLSMHQWFVGEMSRDMATNRLEKHQSGTFLIRTSCSSQRTGEYALSVKFGSSVKQIRVNRTTDNMFYIADCRLFRNLPELVEYYQTNALEPSFPELKTKLVTPYKDAVSTNQIMHKSTQPGRLILGYCIASFDYSANQPNQLSVQRGDKIAILSKAGEDRGWWKGQLNNRIGYFPRAYVVEEGDVDSLAMHFDRAL